MNKLLTFKSRGITPKQKSARIKNFSKLRIRGSFATLSNISDLQTLSLECRKNLKMARKYVQIALDHWDGK